MVNVSVSGSVGTGKTLFITFLGLLLADSGKKVYSNFYIEHDRASLIGIYELAQLLRSGLDNPNNSPLFNAVILGSELYGWIDARRSAAKENVLFSYFIFQCRKLGFDVLYDCQLLRSVDVRLRELTDISFEAERVQGGFRYWLLDAAKVADGESVRTGRSLFLSLDLAKSFWDRYKSYKVVEPLGFEDLIIEMEKFSPEHLRKRVNSQVELLVGHPEFFVGGRVSQAAVRYALLMLGESVAFDDLVSVGLMLRLQQNHRLEQEKPMFRDRSSDIVVRGFPRWNLKR